MAVARYILPLPLGSRLEFPIRMNTYSATGSPILSSTAAASTSLPMLWRRIFLRSSPFSSHKARASQKGSYKASAEQSESERTVSVDTYTNFKHVLLPITDPNPYLSEGTKQAAATTAALAKQNGADITVVVIGDKSKDSIPEHDARLSSIRWHLSEGGFQEFGLIERLGEGKKPTAIIGEVADEMNHDLVVLSMEAIHSNHVDGNLLAEFIPCPVLLLPL